MFIATLIGLIFSVVLILGTAIRLFLEFTNLGLSIRVRLMNVFRPVWDLRIGSRRKS